ncbi:MAG: SGNH/GDSL hydrolase family protein [Planctomycetes bacterium]|nr:SGNH/GDSL hydrolase family protein [Planctomycetota bacterium]
MSPQPSPETTGNTESTRRANPAGRPGRWKRRALLAAASLILSFLVCEMAVRLLFSDDDLNRQYYSTLSYHVNEGYELVPNTEESVPGYRVRINSLGYRDQEFPAEKPPGTFRILVLGDSVVFGPRVNLEETFTKRLEARLRAQDGGPYEVINGGNPDTGMGELLRIFQKRDLQVQPDLVLVCFYLNDSRPPVGFRSEFTGGDSIVRGMQKYPGLRRSLFFSWAYGKYYQALMARRLAGGPNPNLPFRRRMQWVELFENGAWREHPAALNELIEAAEFDWGAAWRPETWPEVEEQFRALDHLCREHRIRPVLVPMPVSVQVHASVHRTEPQEHLARTARALGWPFYDPLPGLLRARGGPPLFDDHCHFTVAGHEEMAGLLFQFLNASLLETVPASEVGP